MKIKTRVKTLEELLSTPGVNFNEGVFRCKGEAGGLPSCMFIYCGEEIEGFSTEGGGLVTNWEEYIEKWMCSEWEEINNLNNQALQALGRQEVVDNEGRVITLECNDNALSTLIEKDNNIFISIEGQDGEMMCAGLTFNQWETLNEQVEKIRKFKSEVMDYLERGEIDYEG